jgi:hypothetical protein
MEQQQWREVARGGGESDDDGDEWSDDGPDPEEKLAKQSAILASFETLKKANDDANEALRQRFLEDATAH